MTARQVVYLLLAVVGLISTMYCNMEGGNSSGTGTGSFSDRFLAILSGFVRGNVANSFTMAIWLNFLLGCAVWTSFVCRLTPGTVCRRLGWQYFGTITAVAFGFPLQAAVGNAQPKRPPADAAVTWLGVVLTYGVGWLCTFYASEEFIVFWIFGLWPMGAIFYDRLVGAGSALASSYRALAAVCFLLGAASWANALWMGGGSPFATWTTASVFCDYTVLALSAAVWVHEIAEDVQLAVVALLFPAAGMCLAFDHGYWKDLQKTP